MFGIDMGVSGEQQGQYNNLTAASNFATGMGESDLTASSDFMRSILSGDPTKISTALSPQISAVQKRTQQQKNETAQFAPRSGGTAATTAALDTAGRGAVTELTGSLTGKAASDLGTMGDSLLKAGMAGNEAGFSEAETLHKEKMAKFNDIVNSIAQVVSGIAGMPGVSPGMAQGLNAGAGMIGG